MAPITHLSDGQHQFHQALRRNLSQLPCITFCISEVDYPRFDNKAGIFCKPAIV